MHRNEKKKDKEQKQDKEQTIEFVRPKSDNDAKSLYNALKNEKKDSDNRLVYIHSFGMREIGESFLRKRDEMISLIKKGKVESLKVVMDNYPDILKPDATEALIAKIQNNAATRIKVDDERREKMKKRKQVELNSVDRTPNQAEMIDDEIDGSNEVEEPEHKKLKADTHDDNDPVYVLSPEKLEQEDSIGVTQQAGFSSSQAMIFQVLQSQGTPVQALPPQVQVSPLQEMAIDRTLLPEDTINDIESSSDSMNELLNLLDEYENREEKRSRVFSA